LDASLTIVALILGGALGGVCAAYAGRIVTAQMWDESQASIAAKWCFASYAGSSLLLSVLWNLNLRSKGEMGEGQWAVLLRFHVVGCLLAYPCALVGSYAGQIVGGWVGIFTAPFGDTWLDIAVATSGKGCAIGAAIGAPLPWLLLLTIQDFKKSSPTPPAATNAAMPKDFEDAVN
jgi:hypothetical protein